MTDEIDERYLITEGVTSVVMETEQGGPDDERRAGLGHIALFDWDDHVTPDMVAEMYRENAVTGPTLVFESSDGSFHGWNLAVRGFPATAQHLERGHDDVKHRRVGEDRGWWRLRVGEKRRVTDEVYKPAPEFVRCFMDDPGSRGHPISDPHLSLARVCEVPPPVISMLRNEYTPVGDGLEVVAYATMTDIEKTLRRRFE